MNNKLLIATAGAGKTTYLVRKALEQASIEKNASILITTYTRSNAAQIRTKIKEENQKETGVYAIPNNIVVQEWFSFLLKEGIRPFKALMDEGLKYKSISLYPDFQYNKNIFIEEIKVLDHYFIKYRIIVNSLSNFTVKANIKSEGGVIKRLSNIYSHMFVDEVQDLAGYDLELIKALFQSSINVLLVGDPRQVTYLTHHEKINLKYKYGKIKDYLVEKCKEINYEIDETTLIQSHRNNSDICEFSSKLYPSFEKSIPCICSECRKVKNDEGIFILKSEEIDAFKSSYRNERIGILRWQKSINPEKNFGDSKGLTYDRVIIFPTGTIITYLKNGKLTKTVKNKKGDFEEEDAFDIAKFYVAVTRARYTVGIVYDYKESENFIDGIVKYSQRKEVKNLPDKVTE